MICFYMKLGTVHKNIDHDSWWYLTKTLKSVAGGHSKDLGFFQPRVGHVGLGHGPLGSFAQLGLADGEQGDQTTAAAVDTTGHRCGFVVYIFGINLEFLGIYLYFFCSVLENVGITVFYFLVIFLEYFLAPNLETQFLALVILFQLPKHRTAFSSYSLHNPR